jgi:hypothetical protein
MGSPEIGSSLASRSSAPTTVLTGIMVPGGLDADAVHKIIEERHPGDAIE